MKIKGVIEDLKIKTKKNDHKNISRTFSGVVVGSVGSVHFRIVPWSSLYFSRSIGPSYVVGTNDRVLIYCTCHFQGSFLCFSFFCLLVSSASVFCPDTRGKVVDTFFFFFRLTCSVALWGGRDAANK